MLENTIALVFWGLKFTNHCLDHIDIDSKSLFITSSIVYGLWLEYEREVSSQIIYCINFNQVSSQVTLPFTS
jgi:hypothetical protein